LGGESFNLSQSFFIGPHPEREYRVEVTFDDPEDGYCIDELPELDKIADYGKAQPTEQDLPEVGELNEDLQAAQEAGLEPEHLGGGKWALLCPWRHEHTKETVKSSASYFEPHTNGFRGAGFKCLHDHCAERGIVEFREALGLTNKRSEEAQELARYAEMGQRGAAEVFEKNFKGQFVFDHTTGEWFEFMGHSWGLERTGNRRKEAMDQLQQNFEQAEAEIAAEITLLAQKIRKASKADKKELEEQKSQLEKQQSAINKICNDLNKLSFRKQVEEFAAQGADSLGITGEEWDRLPWSLAVPNGVIDLRTGELRNGQPEDYLRSKCPTYYNPNASAPRWEQALHEIMGGDQELVNFLQRVFGMALIGEVIEHKLIVLYGAGRNGKDTILETLGHVLGEHIAGAIQSEMFLEQGSSKPSSGPSADIMRLRGLRLGWASETNEGRRLNVSRVKHLTGGGAIVGRAPYARYEVSFPQTHTLFLLTNSKPHAPPEDFALWKRLILIPFTQSFVEEPQEPHEWPVDKELLSKLREEGEGILGWLVRGCLEWQREGLNPPQEVRAAVLEYQREEDTILQFVEDSCVQGPNCLAPANKLYKEYKAWAENNGLRPMNGNRFGRRMAAHFGKERTNRGVFYSGIGLLSEEAQYESV
jgi:putative DNA primase/helicase